MALEEKQEREEEEEEQEGIHVMENTSSESEEGESEIEEINQDKNQGLLSRQYGNFRDYYERRVFLFLLFTSCYCFLYFYFFLISQKRFKLYNAHFLMIPE